MFTVKCDGQWLYNPQLNYQLINPKLTLADCAAGSFEFTMDKTHPLYDKVYEITSRVYVYRNGALIWEGRPIKEKDDWYGNRSVTCEGALAYLNDTIQEQAEYHDNSVKTWLTTLINKHNAKVDASRQFKIGTITVEDNLYRYTNYETTLEAINDKLLSRLGGHLRVRKSGNYNYIDYLKDYPYTSTQKIEFGRNLLDFSKSYDLENIVTAILPLGARLEDSAIEALEAYTDISSVNTDGTWHTKNTPYIQNKAAVDSFGWICKVVRWDDVTEPANLYTKAKKYLTEFQYNDLDLEIKAIDFNFVDSQIEALNILDRVQVISKPHGLDKLFPISKMEITLNNIADTTLTLGAGGYLDDTTMTSKNNAAVNSLLKKIEEIPTESYLLDEAKAIATELITSGALGSYVIVRPEEIIVTNNLNYTARTAHVWRWNKNGLGFSSTGYDGTFGLAMTADGAIVADMITAGTMRAERIKGGILTLGGSNNANGVLEMRDSTNTVIGRWKNTGIELEKGSIAGPEITVGGTKKGAIIVRPTSGHTVTVEGISSYIDEIGRMDGNGIVFIDEGMTYKSAGQSQSNPYPALYFKHLMRVQSGGLRFSNLVGKNGFKNKPANSEVVNGFTATDLDYSSNMQILSLMALKNFNNVNTSLLLGVTDSVDNFKGTSESFPTLELGVATSSLKPFISFRGTPVYTLNNGLYLNYTSSINTWRPPSNNIGHGIFETLRSPGNVFVGYRNGDTIYDYKGLYISDSSEGNVYCTNNLHADGTISGRDGTLSNNLTVNGKLSVSGQKARFVDTKDYGERELYAYETPSPLFGDVGEAVISEDGKVYIFLESIFSKTITPTNYQVFLQKYGDGDIYVIERNSSYFIVEGTPGLSFGWEIKAKQSDFDQLRLERYSDEMEIGNTIKYDDELESHILNIRIERGIMQA